MRIEKRGLGEYLVGGPAEVNDCESWRDDCQCNVHFNGQHISTSRPDADGAEYILSRWPIETSADVADQSVIPMFPPGTVHGPIESADAFFAAPASTLRSAEEIAETSVVGLGLEPTTEDRVRIAMANLIEQRDAEHAAALQVAKPRDLAGRIRALLTQKANEYAATESEDHSDALLEVIEDLWWVAHCARRNRPIANWIKSMRSRDRLSEHLAVLRQTADEIEVIARDCEEGR
jgi:hypothetical protein